MDAEDTGYATEKDASLSTTQTWKDIIKAAFFAQSWLSGQYASKALKITGRMPFQNDYWIELKNPWSQI